MRTRTVPLVSLGVLVALAGCGDDTGVGGAGGSGGGGTGGAAPVVVDTPLGAIEGYLDGMTRTFVGIPYAEPPVGELRWAAPVPKAAHEGTLKAQTEGAVCAQLSALNNTFLTGSSEDCLFLNVWTPSDIDVDAKRPVMVWIHGGGYVLGAGSDDAYSGRRLSEATGAVVVSLNYRLAGLGFLGLQALKSEDPAHASTGDYGLEDQRVALAWVKANIAGFGGDPTNVTIFGESAGGASVCQHLVSPGSAGLFQRAIIESGPCDLVVSEAEAFTQGEAFATALGCAADDLACLRGKSAEEVLAALPAGGFGIEDGGAVWYPMIDGEVLPDRPSVLLEQGKVELPVILGSNAQEGSLFFRLGNVTIADEAELATFAEGLVPGHGAEIAAQYPIADYASANDAAIAAVGDAGFVCPTRRAARALAAGGAPTFLYHFSYGPTSLFGELGAFHSAEITYVLGNPGPLLPAPLTEEEQVMSAAIMGYWSRHATSGDPNGEGVAWPTYDAAGDAHLTLDMTITAGAGLRKAQCDFWDTQIVP